MSAVMARRQGFKQGDVTRALKGAVAAGLKPSRVEIDAAGRIVLDFGQGTPAAEANPFDSWKAQRDARRA